MSRDPECCKRISESLNELWKDPIFREKRIQKIHEYTQTDAFKVKVSESTKRALADPLVRSKISISSKGRKHTQTTKQKISIGIRNFYKSPENRNEASNRTKLAYVNNPEYREKIREKTPLAIEQVRHLGFANRGKIRSLESRLLQSKTSKGRVISKDHRMKISKSLSGERSPNWKGGVSFEPYCPKFNTEFRERVRAFFGYVCPECGTPQNGKKLAVHHVNFNKDSCCDPTVPRLFIPLCPTVSGGACHSKTNHNRGYWEQHFTDMIMGYYEGKCYFTEEEMIQLNGELKNN